MQKDKGRNEIAQRISRISGHTRAELLSRSVENSAGRATAGTRNCTPNQFVEWPRTRTSRGEEDCHRGRTRRVAWKMGVVVWGHADAIFYSIEIKAAGGRAPLARKRKRDCCGVCSSIVHRRIDYRGCPVDVTLTLFTFWRRLEGQMKTRTLGDIFAGQTRDSCARPDAARD